MTLLLLVVAVSIARDIPIQRFTRDTADLAQIYPLSGVLSNLGVLLWCSTAAICLFTYAFPREQQPVSPTGQFLLLSGLLTVILFLDDLFQLHERLFPDYFGIPGLITYALYGGATLFAFVWPFGTIRFTEYRPLAIAMFCFGLSIPADVFFHESSFLHHLVEDCSKFIGIASWFIYFSLVCMHALRLPGRG